MYRRLIARAWDASFIYLDEFDAFYHYEMADQVIRFFKRRYPKCQMIMTSHNTNLMTNRLMRPDCLFILSREGNLTALCNATQRELREGHNLEKMYISGEFENMNKYTGEVRKRSQNLLIVEGNHEKTNCFGYCLNVFQK